MNDIAGSRIELELSSGFEHLRKGNHDEARRIARGALPTGRSTMAAAYVLLGDSYFSEGRYTTALMFFFSALTNLQRRRELSYRVQLLQIRSRIANSAFNLSYYKLAIDIAADIPMDDLDQYYQLRLLTAMSHIRLGNAKEAIPILQTLATETKGNVVLYGSVLTELVGAFALLGDLKSAREQANIALAHGQLESGAVRYLNTILQASGSADQTW